jgi:hypothetical protein
MAGVPIGLSWCTSRLRSIAPTASRYRKAPRSMKMLSLSRRLLAVLALLLPAALVAPGAAWATIPAEPDFQTPVDAKTGTDVTFTVDEPCADVTYTWDTDGDPATWLAGTSATVSYPTAGDKTVTLRATANDGSGDFSEKTKSFTVTAPGLPPSINHEPAASFSVSNSRPIVGDCVTLTSTSQDPDGQAIVQQTWSANGGSYSFSAPGAPSTTVTFGEAGDWKVTLEVSDGALTSTKTKTIHVSNAPPPPNQLPNIPSFSFTPERPEMNEVVRFTASASDPDGTIESIEWDFDNDGIVDASGTSVQRVFTQGGTATVVLIVTDDRGGERRAFQTITVAGAGSLSGTATSEGNVTGAPTGTNINPGTTPNRSGTSSVRLLNPIIRLRGAIVSGRTRISLLQVYGVPRGAKVRARCRGGGCPKGLVVSTARTSGRSIRLRAFERRLSPGATIEVFVTQSGRLGKYTSWRIMRTKAPIRTDKCIRSYGGKTSTCPSGD